MSNSKATELSARVDALETLVSKLSVGSVGSKKANVEDKKQRNVTDKGILHKAKLLSTKRSR